MHHRLNKLSTLLLYFVLVAITPCKASLGLINNKYQTLYATIGGAVDFDCRLTDPNMKVELFREKTQLPVDGFKLVQVGQMFTLYNISMADNGDYKCKTLKLGGLRSSFGIGQLTSLNFPGLNLKLNVSPKIDSATEGEGTSFTCKASSPRGLKVGWYKDMKVLAAHTRNGNDYTSVLNLTDLEMSDSGVYECRVKVKILNGGFVPEQAELIVKHFKFTARHQPISVGTVGSTFNINCGTTDPNASTTLWVQHTHHPPQQVTPDGLRIVKTGPRYAIHRVTVNDGGKYICKAVTQFGKAISMDMGRFIPLQGGHRNPKALISPRIKNLNLDKDFNFTCQAFGDSINFTWYKDSSLVPDDMVTVLPKRLYQGYTMFESILMIRNAERIDEAIYTCHITSGLQPGYGHSVTANLTIYECPESNGKFRDPFNSTGYIECVNGTGTRYQCPMFGQLWEDSLKECIIPATTPTTPFLRWITDYTVKDKFLPISSSFDFDCRLTNSAVPVQLKKDDVLVPVDGRRVKRNGQIFTVSNLQIKDIGLYSCHANGVFDTKAITIRITKDLTHDLSVLIVGGNNRIELEITFNKTVVCESFNEGDIRWYKMDPLSKALVLITKGPKPKRKHENNYIVTTAYLELSYVSQKDAGVYMCRKNNSVRAVANATIQVTVKVPARPTVRTSLQEIAKEHISLQFKVSLSGSPMPDITWYKGQQPVVICRGGQSFICKSNKVNYEIDDQIDLRNRGDSLDLFFKIVDPSYPADNDEHRIDARNVIGKDRTKFNVSVFVPPEIKKRSKEIKRQVAVKNMPFKLVCEVRRAVPTPVITWEYQVSPCTHCLPDRLKWLPLSPTVAQVGKNTSMRSELNALPTTKFIYYRCNATNDAGGDKKDFGVIRSDKIQEPLTIEGESIKYEHENITLTCKGLLSFIGPPSWLDRTNRLLTNTSRTRIIVTQDATDYITQLKIFGANINDSGVYICQAIKNDGERDVKKITLNVRAVSLPSVSIRNQTVNESNDVTLHCMVSGHPPPAITWFSNGLPLEKKKTLSSLSECSSRINDIYYLKPKSFVFGKPQTNSLVICNVKYSNRGWYKCKARNNIGQHEEQAYLNVQASPNVVFSKIVIPEVVDIGDTVRVVCTATGNPVPYVRWLKENDNGTFVSAEGNMSFWGFGSKSLVIRDLKHEQYGKYRCIAKNLVGEDHKDQKISKPPVLNRVTKHSVTKSSLIAVVVPGCLVILLLLVIIAVLYKRKKLYGGFYILTLPPMPDYIRKLDPSRTLQEQTHKLPVCAEWEFSRNRLSLGKVIGSGAFGQVFKAEAVGIVAFDPRSSMKGKGGRRRSRFGSTRSPYYNNKQVTVVACKGLKESATEAEYRDLVSELKILMHIGEHKNIVNLLGACTKGRQCDLLVIIEFCPHGNLLEFLRKRRDLFEAKWAPATDKADERFTTTDLVITAFQVARAMEFLASRRCVHRDLAARNVLVGENYVMKVADFGLARDIYKNEHYVKTTAGLLPVKWMAIEALVDRIYTHQSDVWSFGVLLWEIFTLGGSPYPGLPANEVYQYLMEGHRMEQPHDCPEEVYALMLECWEHDPTRRPAFSSIVQTIDKLLEEKTTQTGEEYLELENDQDVNENQPYYLEPDDMHSEPPVFDNLSSPLPPIPSEEIELQQLINNKNGQYYSNSKRFDFPDPQNRVKHQGSDHDMEKARADSMEKENQKKSESSVNISDDEFISEKEHLMKDFEDEKDVCERNSGVFDTPPPYINTRPYANVNNFIKSYGNDEASSKKEESFRPRQPSARYV